MNRELGKMKKLVASILVFLSAMGVFNATAEAHNHRVLPVSSFSWGNTGGAVQLIHKPEARHHKFTHRSAHSVGTGHKSRALVVSLGSPDLVTVSTAAGIPIRVNVKVANQFQGFVADLVKMGYTPKHIGCWAPLGTHVAGSNHYHGGACDFDQTGWGKTASTMYHVGAIATKWGLRDGCTFRRPDCGHIDDGTNIGWRHPNNLIARYVDYQTTPVRSSNAKVTPLETFEE